MTDYSCHRGLDLRIAGEILGLQVGHDETYVSGTAAGVSEILPIPQYSSDDAAAESVMTELTKRGWKFEIVASGAKGRVRGGFRGWYAFKVAKPGRLLAHAPIRKAASSACAAMSALVEAFDQV